MARICRADEVRCPRHRRVSEQSAGDQPQGPGSVRSGSETGHIPNDDIAAGKGEPARLRKGGTRCRAGTQGRRSTERWSRSFKRNPADRSTWGAQRRALVATPMMRELAAIYEYLTHLPSS